MALKVRVIRALDAVKTWASATPPRFMPAVIAIFVLPNVNRMSRLQEVAENLFVSFAAARQADRIAQQTSVA